MNENNVTSKCGGAEERTLICGEAEGTSNTMLYNAKKEQRNKSLQGNAMSRCNSYKLITEEIVLNVANYK